MLVGDLALVRRQMSAPVLKRVQAVHAERLMLLFDTGLWIHRTWSWKSPDWQVKSLYAAPNAEEKIYVETAAQKPGRRYAVQLSLAGAPVEWDAPVRGSGRSDRKPPSFISAGAGSTGPNGCFRLAFF